MLGKKIDSMTKSIIEAVYLCFNSEHILISWVSNSTDVDIYRTLQVEVEWVTTRPQKNCSSYWLQLTAAVTAWSSNQKVLEEQFHMVASQLALLQPIVVGIWKPYKYSVSIDLHYSVSVGILGRFSFFDFVRMWCFYIIVDKERKSAKHSKCVSVI